MKRDTKSSLVIATTVRSGSMGRPRKSKPGEGLILSFRAEEMLIAALDDEAKHIARERRRVTVSRSEAVKALLWEALDRRTESRKK